MNPQLKAKWVEALRSGKYEQGRQFLNKDGKLCCLGVLCEIDPSIKREDGDYVFSRDDARNTILPASYLDQTGLGYRDSRLMEMNDEFGKSFDQIALHIERNIR